MTALFFFTCLLLSFGAAGLIGASINYLVTRDVYDSDMVDDRKRRAQAAHSVKVAAGLLLSALIWPVSLPYFLWVYVGRFFLRLFREFRSDLNATW